METEYPFEYEVITSKSDVGRALKKLGTHDVYGIDTETTGLDWEVNELIGVSIANQDTAFYFTKDALSPFLDKLKLKASNPNHLFVLHNAIFDLHFLAKVGIRFARVADTLLASFMIDENRSQALKPLAEHYLNTSFHLPTFKEMQKITYEIAKAEYQEALNFYRRKNPAGGTPLFPTDDPPVMRFKSMKDVGALDMPVDSFGRYAALDPRLTYDIWEKLQHYLVKDGVNSIYWDVEMAFLPILFEMEETGMGIDRKALHTLKDKYTITVNELHEKLKGMVGNPDFNPNSDQQLAKYLYEVRGFKPSRYTEKKAPSTDVIALMRLSSLDSSGFVDTLLDYRTYQKLLSTYILPFIEITDGRQKDIDEPRIYGHYNQTGTVTGRLSAESPNLQNIPSRRDTGKEVRQLFVARKGYVLVDCDYSQLELRILAHFSNDIDYIELFKNGGDPHQATADLIGVDRRIGKTLNFAWAYGAGPGKLCDTIEKEGNPRPLESDAKEWIARFEEARPALTKWRDSVVKYARSLGYVKTIAGRRRHIPELKSYDKQLRSRAERQCVNSISQGSASDIIKIASIKIKKEFTEKNLDAKFIGQIHDELLVEVREDQKDVVAEIMQRQMISAGEFLKLRVPLEASPGIGRSWGDAH